MTDSEKIIKDLQNVTEWFTKHGRNTNTAVIEIAENALDLIKRLQTKNKEFDEKIVMQRGLIDWQKAEIERLDKLVIYNASCVTRLHKDLFNAKTEAIKEFADKLCDGRVSNDPVVIAVQAELKMTEE